jgi:hypothetical protein
MRRVRKLSTFDANRFLPVASRLTHPGDYLRAIVRAKGCKTCSTTKLSTIS